jgi:hypothetical protein
MHVLGRWGVMTQSTWYKALAIVRVHERAVIQNVIMIWNTTERLWHLWESIDHKKLC